MKKMIFFLLLITSCWSATETIPPTTILVEPVQNNCPIPGSLQIDYNEIEKTILVEWEEAAVRPAHYMISLDEQAYEVVSFTNKIKATSSATSHLFTGVGKGPRSVCVRSVCFEEEETLEILVPVSSEKVCVNLELSLGNSVVSTPF